MDTLAGQRIALLGKLASMSKREAQQMLRGRGATVLDRLDATATLAVVGEAELPGLDRDEPLSIAAAGDESARQAVERGDLRVVTETELWRELGLLDDGAGDVAVRRLYTPAMLADLLGVPLAVVRRWHRRGLIVPAHEVRKLPYFDFQEITTARRLAELVAAGVSPAALEQKLTWLARFVPGASRPLAQLSVLVEGRQLLLRQGDGLIEPGGQYRFDFDASDAVPRDLTAAEQTSSEAMSAAADPADDLAPPSVAQLIRLAEDHEDAGRLAEAIEWYRSALAAGGPTAELCFRLGELLYRLGKSEAACERYYQAIELDEDFVEARANLGCVLAELGQIELAAAALQGALAFHPEFPDAHFHLARLLDQLGRGDEAQRHWGQFARLAPDSPWSEEAHSRLSGATTAAH